MNDELMKRARELLALQDEAVKTCGGDLNDILVKMKACQDFINCAHDMADTIRDLLAEVERLKQEATANAYKWTVEARRAETAEARYAALCEAEPVAVVDTYGIGRILWLALVPDGVQLILRPSMEDFK